MTRREEIVTATLGCRQNYVDLKRPITPDDVADAFEKGAYWADKTMIEKACKWIKEHIDIPYEGRMIDGEPEAADYIEWAKERLKCAEEVAEAFRKAMEE